MRLRWRSTKRFEKHIAAGEVFVGDLTADGDIRIDGAVRGRITSPGRIVIGPGGQVEADVRASELVVAGELRGEAEATRRLHVLQGGRLFANAKAALLLVEEGAVCNGCVLLRTRRPDGNVEEVPCRLPAGSPPRPCEKTHALNGAVTSTQE